MPHLTIQITQGPVLDVAIGVSKPRADALSAAGEKVPTPIVVRGLVDTGASCSCVDPGVLTSLNLTPKGKGPVHSATTDGAAVEQDIYDVAITLIHPDITFTFQALPVLALNNLNVQGIHALIGRDMLEQCLLVYDGQTGLFTLAF